MSELSTKRIDKLRWPMLVLVMLVGMTSAFLNCLSVFIGPLSMKGWDPTIVVMAYSVMMVMAIPGSLIGGKLKAKFGNRFVLKVCGLGFTVSVLVAAFAPNAWVYVIAIGGFAPLFVYCIYVAQIANLGELFPDKRGLVTGALSVGIFLAGALVVPVCERMTSAIHVTPTIVVFALVIGGITILSGFILLQAPEGYKPEGWEEPEYEILEGGEAEGIKDVGWKKLITLKSFWLITIASLTGTILTSGIQGNFIILTGEITGASEATAAWIYTIFSMIMGISAIVVGGISDKVLGPVKIIAIACLAVFVMTLFFILTNAQSTPMYIVFVAFIGLEVSAFSTLIAVILMRAYGTKNFGINFGLAQVGVLIGSSIGPQLAIRGADTFLIVSAAGVLLCGIVMFILAKALNKELGKKVF